MTGGATRPPAPDAPGSDVRIEVLDDAQVEAAMPLAEAWAYGPDEFAHLVALSQGTSVVALDDDERAVGITLGFPWPPVGWIGSVRVLDDQRGRGVGQALVEASIERLRDKGCETVKLYAAPKAISLYERVGFVGEAEFTTAMGSHRRGRDPEVEPAADHLDACLALDRAVFPGDRSRHLRDLVDAAAERAVCVVDDAGDVAGFGVARPLEPWSEIGPVVVRDDDAGVAQRLVDALLTRLPEGDVEVTYPSRAFAASSSWSCRGFVATDHPLEMRLGPAVDERRGSIVAVGGQELG